MAFGPDYEGMREAGEGGEERGRQEGIMSVRKGTGRQEYRAIRWRCDGRTVIGKKGEGEAEMGKRGQRRERE